MVPKSILREQMRARRDALAQTNREAASRAATSHSLAHSSLESARVVALYASIGSELSTRELAAALLARGKRLVFPRVTRRPVLEFAEISSLSDLRPSALGIPEPPLERRVDLSMIDLLFVPGLGFDRNGARIGWGKGYYDATLLQHASAVRVGLCFGVQLIPQVPTEDWDQTMDWIISEAGSHECPQRR